jgi:hypothetical protein
VFNDTIGPPEIGRIADALADAVRAYRPEPGTEP